MGAALGLLPLSCATPGLGTYSINLSQVALDQTPVQTVNSYHFQDNRISIDWKIENTRFAFSLTNVSGQSIRIPWDEAVYVDQAGKARRVIHEGITYERKSETQPPTVIPHGAGIDDFLLPVDNIVAENKNYVSWQTFYLFYDRQKNVGQKVKVVLPVVMQNNRYDYAFTFEVTQWREDAKKRSFPFSLFSKTK